MIVETSIGVDFDLFFQTSYDLPVTNEIHFLVSCFFVLIFFLFVKYIYNIKLK